ncbi:hypothetical protein [Ekhidna sp.]|uniref:hypothetical protein n=1 Tax=Ekhidna sp. TaxID=2608089 RepID=UPI003C7E8E58
MIRIGILIHENQNGFLRFSYLINELIKHWNSKGYKIYILKGANQRPQLDLLINHVDVTKLPPQYCELIQHYPNVINGKTLDISKRNISTQLVSQHSDYQGPVIVKPNRNARGLTDIAMSVPNGAVVLKGELSRAKKNIVYRVFESLQSVPAAYFSNEELVIEKYLPEREGDMFYLRVCILLGDKHISARVGSKSGVIKGVNVISREIVETPQALLDEMKRRGFDYGKVDYGIHQGEIIIYDTNRTPGHSSNNIQNATLLADGIESFIH